MLNMGGPSSLDGPEDGVKPFLQNLFSDPEIIPLGPLQKWLGDYISTKRTPKIREQYSAIGGKSPILQWTEAQGKEMVKKLDALSPQTAPHKHYVAFRYAPPLTHTALEAMKADGVTRAVAFSQYPHFSCTTTGSSLNHLWRELARLGMADSFQWSLIDRWPIHRTFVAAVVSRILQGLQQFPEEVRSQVILLFTAHSLPMKVVAKGDTYVHEIASTVRAVMEALPPKCHNTSVLAWQSKVGFLPWMAPSTASVIKGLGAQGHKYVLAVPIAFTSDHIETLYEIDIEYAKEAKDVGITMFRRAASLNDEPLLSTAQAELVAQHLESGDLCSNQYRLNCPACTNPTCRSLVNPVKPYQKLRDTYDTPCTIPTWTPK